MSPFLISSTIDLSKSTLVWHTEQLISSLKQIVSIELHDLRLVVESASAAVMLCAVMLRVLLSMGTALSFSTLLSTRLTLPLFMQRRENRNFDGEK